MLVPSDTPSGLLWVEVVKSALFRGLFHINVARKLVAEHFQIFLDFHPSRMSMTNISIIETSWKVTLNIMIHIQPVLGLSEEKFLLGLPPPPFPFVTYSRDSKLNALIIVYLSSDHPMFSVRAQGLICNLGPYPYNSPSKLLFFPSHPGRKSGVLIFYELKLFIPLIYMGGSTILRAL